MLVEKILFTGYLTGYTGYLTGYIGYISIKTLYMELLWLTSSGDNEQALE